MTEVEVASKVLNHIHHYHLVNSHINQIKFCGQNMGGDGEHFNLFPILNYQKSIGLEQCKPLEQW